MIDLMNAGGDFSPTLDTEKMERAVEEASKAAQAELDKAGRTSLSDSDLAARRDAIRNGIETKLNNSLQELITAINSGGGKELTEDQLGNARRIAGNLGIEFPSPEEIKRIATEGASGAAGNDNHQQAAADEQKRASEQQQAAAAKMDEAATKLVSAAREYSNRNAPKIEGDPPSNQAGSTNRISPSATIPTLTIVAERVESPSTDLDSYLAQVDKLRAEVDAEIDRRKPSTDPVGSIYGGFDRIAELRRTRDQLQSGVDNQRKAAASDPFVRGPNKELLDALAASIEKAREAGIPNIGNGGIAPVQSSDAEFAAAQTERAQQEADSLAKTRAAYQRHLETQEGRGFREPCGICSRRSYLAV